MTYLQRSVQIMAICPSTHRRHGAHYRVLSYLFCLCDERDDQPRRSIGATFLAQSAPWLARTARSCGALASLFFAGAVIISLGQTISTGMRHRQGLKGISIAMAGAVIFVGTHSFVDFPLQILGIELYFAALMGAGTRLCMPLQKIVCCRDKSCFGQRKEDRVGFNSETRLSSGV